MNTTQIYRMLEDDARERLPPDWVLLAALADAYEELGEIDMALAVRWLIEHQKFPEFNGMFHFFPHRNNELILAAQPQLRIHTLKNEFYEAFLASGEVPHGGCFSTIRKCVWTIGETLKHLGKTHDTTASLHFARR